MPVHSKKNENQSEYVKVIVFVAVVLLLALFNLHRLSQPPQVLGVTTELPVDNSQVSFWQGFVEKYPTYLTGWQEIYRMTGDPLCLQKMREINPNLKP